MSLFSNRIHCFCAFCKTPRRVYRHKKLALIHVLTSLLVAASIMLAIWQGFDPRGVLIFLLMLFFSEVFVHVRWRLSLICQQCGFDPALYVRNANKAAEKVRLHLEKRKNSPDFLLARDLQLPKIRRASSSTTPRSASDLATQPKNRGSRLSRQI